MLLCRAVAWRGEPAQAWSARGRSPLPRLSSSLFHQLFFSFAKIFGRSASRWVLGPVWWCGWCLRESLWLLHHQGVTLKRKQSVSGQQQGVVVDWEKAQRDTARLWKRGPWKRPYKMTAFHLPPILSGIASTGQPSWHRYVGSRMVIPSASYQKWDDSTCLCVLVKWHCSRQTCRWESKGKDSDEGAQRPGRLPDSLAHFTTKKGT